MKADPKLEIVTPSFMDIETEAGARLPRPEIHVNGDPLTPEEAELAAVVVTCRRARVSGETTPGGFWILWHGEEDNARATTGPTPLAAWRAYQKEVGNE